MRDYTWFKDRLHKDVIAVKNGVDTKIYIDCEQLVPWLVLAQEHGFLFIDVPVRQPGSCIACEG